MAKSVDEYKKEIVRQMKAHRIYSKGLDIQITSLASAAHAATKGVEAGAETTEAGVRAASATTNAAASGPTLAMVGEYAGASGNPEVIAPLDKLQGMLTDTAPAFGKVTFKIAGRTLVGILEKENKIYRRS